MSTSINMKGTGTIEQVGSAIYNAVVNGSLTGECRMDVKATFEDGATRMMVFEKYYYRVGNRASLSVLITQKDSHIRVNAISTGGSTGIFFRFSWGAESKFISIVEKTLKNLGFTI